MERERGGKGEGGGVAWRQQWLIMWRERGAVASRFLNVSRQLRTEALIAEEEIAKLRLNRTQNTRAKTHYAHLSLVTLQAPRLLARPSSTNSLV